MNATDNQRQIADQLRSRLQEILNPPEQDFLDARNDFDDSEFSIDAELVDDAGDNTAASIADPFLNEIQQINNALELIESGDYGYCENCGCPIALERLEVLPFTANCVACQAEQEAEDSLQYVSPTESDGEDAIADRWSEFSLPVALKF